MLEAKFEDKMTHCPLKQRTLYEEAQTNSRKLGSFVCLRCIFFHLTTLHRSVSGKITSGVPFSLSSTAPVSPLLSLNDLSLLPDPRSFCLRSNLVLITGSYTQGGADGRRTKENAGLDVQLMRLWDWPGPGGGGTRLVSHNRTVRLHIIMKYI